MADRVGSTFLTWSGRWFWPIDPRPEELDIDDIAQALARVCRFGGHMLCDHYSVGQHSVLVSLHVPPEDALWGLLHDASEAYLGDVVAPFKRHLPEYRVFEDRMTRCVATRFRLSLPEPATIKPADLAARATEQRDLRRTPLGYYPSVEPWPERIEPWGAQRAAEEFLVRFYELGGERG